MSSEEERMSDNESLADFVENLNAENAGIAGAVPPEDVAAFFTQKVGTSSEVKERFSVPPLRASAPVFSPSFFDAGQAPSRPASHAPTPPPAASEAGGKDRREGQDVTRTEYTSVLKKMDELALEVTALKLKINSAQTRAEKAESNAAENYNAVCTYLQRLEEAHQRDTRTLLEAIHSLRSQYASPVGTEGTLPLVPPSPPAQRIARVVDEADVSSDKAGSIPTAPVAPRFTTEEKGKSVSSGSTRTPLVFLF